MRRKYIEDAEYMGRINPIHIFNNKDNLLATIFFNPLVELKS